MAYRVETSGVLLARIQNLQAEANAGGQGDAFNLGLNELHARLTN
jgi:hypothetical protein